MLMKFAVLAASALLALLPLGATAQATSEIHFDSGSDMGSATGSVTGRDYHDYVLGAREGQNMSVAISVDDSSGDGTVYFNILPPGSDDVAIFNSSNSADNFGEVKLPKSGNYTIRVYQMGNDKDAGATTRYTLSVTIM